MPASLPGNSERMQSTGLDAAQQGVCQEASLALKPVWNRLGFSVLLVVGFGLGLGLSSPSTLPEPFKRIAQVAGWLYFAAWSLSFYPQALTNYTRKSVVGFSLDFAAINFFGFACLSIYYSAFAWSPVVREKYRQVHGADNSVRTNDVFFALHAAALTGFTLGQCALYDRGPQNISSTCKRAIAVLSAAIVVHGLLVMAVPDVGVLGWLYMLSLIKLGITMSKYIPQILLNVRRQSTVGWSVQQVIMDVTGGVLSMFQLVLEAMVLKELSLITGDPVKFLLAVVSLGYDAILLAQHFYWYPAKGHDLDSRSLKAQTSDDTEA